MKDSITVLATTTLVVVELVNVVKSRLLPLPG
jgi:hypothetical protein